MKKLISLICLFCAIFLVANAQTQEITLEKIWKSATFYPKSVPGFATMPNGDYYTVKNANEIAKYSFASGKQTGIILTNEDFNKNSDGLQLSKMSSYQFDKSESKILFAAEIESIYRRSTCAYYFIADLKTGKVHYISPKQKVSFASFSADGNRVAYVRDYNIFYYDLQTEKEIQVTFDGRENAILNGFADWVHEEELDMSKCFWWSPDGSKIAYLRFDESDVKEFSMTMWGPLYPENFVYKYPKAGEDNSKVTIHLYDIAQNSSREVKLDEETDCYFPRIYWLSNSTEFVTLKLNRLQNQIDFYRYNTQTGATDIVFTDKNESWLDVSGDYYFLNDNKHMILTSERNGFNHIYMVEFNGAATQLTQGNYEVQGIASVDMDKQKIYYLSNESDVSNKDLYVIDFKGGKKKMLTDGTGWNEPTFTTNAHYYLNNYSNLNTPSTYAVFDNNGKKLYTLEDNNRYQNTMKEYGFAQREMFSFSTTDGVKLNGWMLKPLNFDNNKKYPVLMYTYGGPGSREVMNAYSRVLDLAWYQMLAQKGYIVVCVDGRGTGGRGDEFKKVIYKQMGKYEAIDQIATANYLKSLSYVDSTRVGIWGWSFGGYLSSLAMFTSGTTFKMAMSVAPVTNWRYYDNIYTERFLQKPQDNASGYDDNSPCTHAAEMQGRYLLVHGTGDDNVHFQNSMDLVTKLNVAEKQYEQFFYPNKNHFIYGGNTRFQLYTKLTNFLLENL